MRTRKVRRFNYQLAAFYVWALALLAFVVTNAAAKFAFMRGAGQW